MPLGAGGAIEYSYWVILVDGQGLGASRPGRPLFSNLSLTVSDGDRIAVVGINGCGKSTLLRYLLGTETAEEGVVRQGGGIRISHLDQQGRPGAHTVRDSVGGEWEGEAILDRLGMTPMLDAEVSTLSGGQQKRVALAAALVKPCDLLVLDEPTNHLDLAAIEWLEDWLSRFRGGLILVTHDRHVLDRVTTKIVELDRGASFVHNGGYASYLDGKDLRESEAATAESIRRNLARTELAWLRRGAPARTRKPKARIDAATALVNARPQAAARQGDLALADLGTSRLGSKVFELHGIGHSFDGQRFLFRGVTHIIEPGDRVAFTGLNGSGKTTLLDVIAGRIAPTEGHVETGLTVRLGYYDQQGRTLDPTQRVREAVAGPTRVPDYDDARLMEKFWFDTDAQWAEIGTLSGGERRRLQLLLVLAEKPNVLILDEPTNDLDLDTLRALEDFLDDWAGTLIAVSHDRAFVARVVEEIIPLERWAPDRRPPGKAPLTRPADDVTTTQAAPQTSTRPTTLPVPTDSLAKPASAPVGRGMTPSTRARKLREAETSLHKLEAQQTQLQVDLAQAGSDHEKMTRLASELHAVAEKIGVAEEAWLAFSD